MASGKSTVTEIFQKLGAYVVSADHIAHQFLSSPTALNKVVSLLGSEVLTDGCIDRKKVAKIVFQRRELLRQLEAFVHPNVALAIEQQYNQAAKQKNYPLFVAEVPLLFEAGQDRWYDSVVAVIAPEPLCMKRFCQTTGYDEQEYLRRASMQLTQAEKAKRANYVIENMGSLEEFQGKATSLFKLLSNGE